MSASLACLYYAESSDEQSWKYNLRNLAVVQEARDLNSPQTDPLALDELLYSTPSKKNNNAGDNILGEARQVAKHLLYL